MLSVIAMAVTMAVPTASAAHAAGGTTPAAATSHAPTSSTGLTVAQATARAKAIGKAVQVTAATTASSTLTANPNGTLTSTESLEPVRKQVGGVWRSLDATLKKNPDGTISPAVTTTGLVFSGGGRGPLATMSDDGDSMSLTLPFALPAPIVSGTSATYANALPGVDLRVTADAQGGFSEVMVVRTAQAAANPGLRALTFQTRTHGVTLHTDSAGDLRATTRTGLAIFTAPAPSMWDSSTAPTPAATITDRTTGQRLDARTGNPLASSAKEPGEGAHAAHMRVTAGSGTLTLTPSTAILTGAHTVYPVYIDPSYASGGTEAARTYVNSYYSSQSYWNASDYLRVGYDDWDVPYGTPAYVARSFVRMGLQSNMYGATVYSSTFYITEENSASCTSREVDLWLTSPISSATTWNTQPGWTGLLKSQSFAYGWSSACPAQSVGFDVTSEMSYVADTAKWSNITFGLRATDAGESDDLTWKRFNPTTAYMTTTYDHAPNTPTSLHTSPVTNCASTAASNAVGNGDVILYAGVSDPDGGALQVAFSAWKTSNTSDVVASSTFSTLSATSGTTTDLRIPKATLDADAGSTLTEYSWRVEVSDGSLTSSWSSTCSFWFDPTTPGPPDVTGTDGTDCAKLSGLTVGTPAAFSITETSTVPVTEFIYQLNGAAYETVSSGLNHGQSTVNGTTVYTTSYVTPTTGTSPKPIAPLRSTNVLTVSAEASGGNIGYAFTCIFNAADSAPAVDKDMTGDGIPDVLTAGDTSDSTGSVPSGLWLDRGETDPGTSTGNGHVVSGSVDIGSEGNGYGSDYSATDFNGAQAVTGMFTGDNFQDVLAYYPSTGEASVLAGSGDGSVIQAQYNFNQWSIQPGAFSDPMLINGAGNADNPTQLANAYHAAGEATTALPDLIGVVGDTTNGYRLDFYPALANISFFNTPLGLTGAYVDGSSTLTTTTNTGGTTIAPTPAGGSDWQNWTIATTQLSSGIAMYLWNKTTGALYLWTGVTLSTDSTNGDDISYTQYVVDNGQSGTFDQGASIATLEAADITGADTTPDLWTITDDGTVTAYLATLNTSTDTATLSTQSTDTLTTTDHAWYLSDNTTNSTTGDIYATDTDTSSSSSTYQMTATGTGATWDSGDLYSPAVHLDGSTALTTTAALNTNKSFTVSAWVKPEALDGVILSQNGTNTSGFVLSVSASGTWQFAIAETDSSSPTYATATTGTTYPVVLNTWTHVTATYNQTNGYMRLYIDGIPAAADTYTSTWNATGAFTVGRRQSASSTYANYWKGKIADVQAWNNLALGPIQTADLSGTPGYVLFPSDNVFYGNHTWTTAHGTMTFNNGLLTIKQTGTLTGTWTEGKTETSAAVMTLQNDGNLVIYPTATAGSTAIWATGTNGNPADVMFFQPDGNLVIYTNYGKTLWSSGTAN